MASMTTRPYRTHHDMHVAPLVASHMPTFAAPPRATADIPLPEHRTIPKEERRVRYAGAEHTLGPTFSDEEDGDDSAYIASQMAALGLDQLSALAPYGLHGSERNTAVDPRPSDRARGPVDAQAQARIQRQLQLQQLAQQQQQALLLQTILANQPRSGQQASQHQLRESLALLELQQAQQASTYPQLQAHLAAQAQQAQRAVFAAQMQQQQQHQLYLQQLRQQQLDLFTNSQQSYSSPSEQRTILAAQVQASLLARTNRARGMNPDDAELRARFESAPNSNDMYKTPQEPSKPVFEQRLSPYAQPAPSTSWRPSQPAAPPAKSANSDSRPAMGRFAQARQAMANDPKPMGSLSSVLTRRRMTDESSASSQSSSTSERKASDSSQTSPTTSFEEQVRAAPVKNLGLGRPSAPGSGVRSATSPTVLTPRTEPAPRAASYTNGQVARTAVVRQPIGPPGDAKELGDKNFQSRIRRQAGLNLGMLGRRTDAASSTPVVA
ncbi:hypothetical protein BCR39DRAFT_587811 [Naematelia encephala]|uniref:Uncharacterized protein n=1 Tax=Naematelia encephala TaxID=71784 RepID=A0A1Y2B8X7_9TREE|nr:hypothetical protein BCR39DRAFT_587811 [Naematelia encephala]